MKIIAVYIHGVRYSMSPMLTIPYWIRAIFKYSLRRLRRYISSRRDLYRRKVSC